MYTKLLLLTAVVAFFAPTVNGAFNLGSFADVELGGVCSCASAVLSDCEQADFFGTDKAAICVATSGGKGVCTEVAASESSDDCAIQAWGSDDTFDNAVKSFMGIYIGVIVGCVLLCCVLPIALCMCGVIACGQANRKA